MNDGVRLFWFRRDLRLDDNAGLYAALKGGGPVVGVFVFDRHILDVLEDDDDARVTFLHRHVTRLRGEIEALGGRMEVRYGTPEDVWSELADAYRPAAVYANRDYEPYALARDEAVAELLAARGSALELSKDHVIFESEEVQKGGGGPYTVFTPYSRRWLERLHGRPDRDANGGDVSYYLKAYPTERYLDAFAGALPSGLSAPPPIPGIGEMGFRESDLAYPDRQADEDVIATYDRTRDIPSIAGTTQVGVHLRHGTLSIRALARRALGLNPVYLSELIWRDFYSQVLQAYPHVVEHSYRREYDEIEWVNDEEAFAAWCEGRTGYPLVDAGMRQLNATGYMHNRVRMLTASFLTKHLLTDWRWGERYFARKLLDYDLASNNGGWQWAAGSGCDASPYFRVFNPTTQLKKFDPERRYVRRWVPEYGTPDYPEPIIDHAFGRERALATYKRGLRRARSGIG